MSLFTVPQSHRGCRQRGYACARQQFSLDLWSKRDKVLPKAKRIPVRLLFSVWKPGTQQLAGYRNDLGPSRFTYWIGGIKGCGPSSHRIRRAVGARIHRVRLVGGWSRKPGITQQIVVVRSGREQKLGVRSCFLPHQLPHARQVTTLMAKGRT